MWGDVCNSCGAHESSVRSVAKCSHCPTLICTGCKYNHEFGCAQAAQMKRYGLGPTVVRTVQVPVEEVTGDTPEITANIPVPTQVTSQVQDDLVGENITQEQSNNFVDETFPMLTPEEIAAGTELLTQMADAITAPAEPDSANQVGAPPSPSEIPSTNENEVSPSDSTEL